MYTNVNRYKKGYRYYKRKQCTKIQFKLLILGGQNMYQKIIIIILS